VDVSRDLIALAPDVADGVREGLPPRARRVADALSDRDRPTRVKTLQGELGMGSIWPEIRLLKKAGALEHETLPPKPPPVKTRRMVELVRDLPTLELREETFGRAHRQREAYEVLEAAGGSDELSRLTGDGGFSRSVITGLEDKEVARVVDREVERDPFADIEVSDAEPPPLTAEQTAAVQRLEAALDDTGRKPFLLHGVTGSGKTRVYIELLDRVLARGQGAIVLVPEISLTPQTVTRFRRRFGDRVAVLHSALSDGERYDAWRQLRRGERVVAVGARSALFAPVRDLGAIVVDEEHDPSLRQHEGLRYSARDLAVMRGNLAALPVVLGSATPSLETLRHAREGHYKLSLLPDRPGGAVQPRVTLVDLRRYPAVEGLSPPLLDAMRAHLDAGAQVMLFLNRRGFAPALFCTSCGWVADCRHCDARYTWHRRARRLRCHHCGDETALPAACAECGADLRPVGEGTERLEDALAQHFPAVQIARIDRDSTRQRGAVERILDAVRDGHTKILIGTQMMAKGHDFPDVTLVGVINADQGLFSTDFRAGERLAQTLVQVSGRAGRAERPGEVMVQTSYPEHPLLQCLLAGGYEAFAEAALEERSAAGWPPYSHLAILRAEAARPDSAMAFLAACRAAVGSCAGVTVLGPAPAPMEKRAGRWRAQLLLQSAARPALHQALAAFRRFATNLPEARGVRFFFEVDPQDLF